MTEEIGIEIALGPTRQLEGQRGQLEIHPVLPLQAVAHHLELQRPHGAQDPGHRRRTMVLEELNRTLLDELGDPLLQGFAFRRRRHFHAHERFRREVGNTRVGEAAFIAHGVADPEDPRIEEPHHIARVGDFDFPPIASHDERRVGQAQGFPRSHVLGRSTPGKATRANPQKGHPIAVIRVHIRLDLENETRKGMLRGLDFSLIRGSRTRAGGQSQKAIEKGFHRVIGEGAAEEHRRLLTRTDRVGIQLGAGALDEVEVFGQIVVIPAQCLANARIVHRTFDHLLIHPGRSVLAPGVQEQALPHAVVDAAKIRTRTNGPIHRHGVDAQDVLDLAHQIEPLASEAIHLVHEGEDRDMTQATDLEEFPRLRLHALGGIHQHDGGVRRHQGAIGILAEILVTGRIENVDAMALVLEIEHRTAHRDAPLLLEFEPIAGGMPRRTLAPHSPGLAHRAPVEEQFLGQGGLARIGM